MNKLYQAAACMILFAATPTSAQTNVAFIEVKNAAGEIQQMEPGGRFSHVAIQYQGQWLHAHPYRGVEVISRADLEKMGSGVSIVNLPELPEPSSFEVEPLIGKPANPLWSWESDSYYCSKLVGKLLQIQPQPMEFSADMWKSQFLSFKAQLWKSLLSKEAKEPAVGLSPDDIFRELSSPAYKARIQRNLFPMCQKVFL